MAHTKASIAKMLASRKANQAAKSKPAKSSGYSQWNGAAPGVPDAIEALKEVASTMPKDATALSENDLRILRALRALTRPETRPDA